MSVLWTFFKKKNIFILHENKLMPNSPSILMTFAANDLLGVQEEIQKTWDIVSQHPDLQANKVENATIEQLADAIIEAGNDLFFFHFGGHADAKGIVLDGFRDLDKIRLSRLLLPRAKHNLQLIFLNGCLSYGHVGILTAKGVKAIIATNVEVNDVEAVRIANYFYKLFIKNGFTLKEAFETAEATISGKNAYLTIVNPGEIDEDQPLQPAWTLFIHAEHKEVMDWTLQDFLTNGTTTSSSSSTQTTQLHTGSGDNIGRDKIDRQVNMGIGSTYIENSATTSQSPIKIPKDTKQQVQSLVVKGKLAQALDLLKKYLPPQATEITLLQNRLTKLERDVRMNVLTTENERTERNQIVIAILDLGNMLS